MRLKKNAAAYFFGVLAAIAIVRAAAAADTNSADASDPRFGLFNGLDHRSVYNTEFFPEPLLVDDMGLEDNELELSWLHTKGNDQQTDIGTAEFQKGFGLLTLQVEVPYGRNVSADQIAKGIGNIDLGARYPLYQYVSDNRFVDATFGAALEGGIPVGSSASHNSEFDPKIFNNLKLGNYFTVQSVFGYSTLFGSGDDDGLRTFEYGFNFGCIIPHNDLPLPGVQQFIPMFEVVGETELNKEETGQNSLLGDIGFRVKFKPMGEMQPGLGLGYIFPIDSVARQELHWGFIVSLVFEF